MTSLPAPVLSEIREAPGPEEKGIISFVYRADRPFHPGRLVRLVRRGFEGVIRSRGRVWLASRPEVAGVWSLEGNSYVLDPGGPWAARGQLLVFVGVEMDRAEMTAMLDDALLTDSEMELDPEGWRTFPDPFPAWEQAGGEVASGCRVQ